MKLPPLKRLLGSLAVVAMVGFAAEGGEYGTFDLLKLKAQVRGERDSIVRLRTEVDSLTRFEQALKSDPATQERVAREVFGMIRPGEMLYQVVPGDSAKR
ncbi:MAG: septum formation initiator family protein [Gemmatimonadales bacterium]|jgi:cell division protein FtsB